MSQKILVAYASRTGSTAGVAEMIGKTLSEAGHQLDVLPMKDVKEIVKYDAVIAGSAIQSAAWLPEAVHFVRVHQPDLKAKPFAAFLVCMTLAMKNGDYRQQVTAWMDPVCRLVMPVSKGLFAGALDIHKVPNFSDRVKFRLSVKLGVWADGDHRDWTSIRVWTESLIPLMGLKPVL